MSCSALKKNFHDCHNWSCLDSFYCHQHRTLSDEVLKERWIQRFLLGSSEYPIFTFRNPKQEKRILEDLRSGKILLTKEDLLKLPAKDRYTDIYLFLLRHGFAKLGDHPHLEFVSYWLWVSLRLGFPAQDPLPQTRQTLESYLILGSGQALYNFLFFICGPIKGRSKLTALMVQYIPSLLDTEAAKELSWFPRAELDKLRIEYEKILGADHPITRCLVLRWLLDLKELYLTEKAIQKMKMDQCKEELMMNRWHPDRVAKFLYAGIDPEDM